MKLFYVVLCICLMGSTFGHQCFQCSDYESENPCNGDESPVTCGDEPWQSRKYCVLDIYDSGNEIRYKRNCMTIYSECNPGETSTIPRTLRTIQSYRCCEGDRCNDPKLMPIPNRTTSEKTPKPKSSSSKLTNQSVLFFSILLVLFILQLFGCLTDL